MKLIRENLTYANVMSTIAVLLVIGGGTAIAAGLGKNVVHSRNIAPGAVKTSDIAKGAVKQSRIGGSAIDSSRLANGAVTTEKLDGNAVTGAKIADGAVDSRQLSAGIQGKVDALETANIVRADVVGTTEAGSPKIPLMSRGPFSFYGKCYIDPGNVTVARTYVATTVGGTLATGTAVTFKGGTIPPYLDPSTPESQTRVSNLGIVPANANSFGGAATLINGSNSISFAVTGFAKGASVAADAANYGAGGGRCLFSPSLVAYSG